jgi:hypothetical protein
MAQEVALGLKRDGSQADQSVSSLKKQLREAQNEVANLSDKFGATSKQAIEAAKSAAILKDKIGDAKALTEAFNPDAKFKALTASLSGVAGGFSALQGSIALFGNESEELQKQLLKVQAAMAFSNGIQQVGESIDSFKQLGAVIKSQVVGAFSTLRGAIAATGIGALVVGVGLLIANFDKVKEAVLNAIPGLATFGKFIGGLVQKVTDFVGVTSDASRELDRLKNASKKSLEDANRFLDLNGDKYDKYTKAKFEADINYKKKKDEILNNEKLSEEEKNNFLKQAEAQRTRIILSASNERAADEKKRYDEKSKQDKDRFEKEKAEADLRNQQRKDQELRFFNDRLKAIDALNLQRKKEKDDQDKTEKEILDAAAEAIKKQDEIDNDSFAKMIKKTVANNAEKEKLDADLRQRDLAATIQLEDAKFAAVSAGLGALSALAGDNEKLANSLFVVDKALAIAKIVVDTQREIAGYFAAYSAIPVAGPALAAKLSLGAKIRAGIGIAAIGATTIAKFKGSSSATIAGGGGGSSVAPQPLQAPLTPTVSRNAIDQQTINDRGNAAGRQTTVVRAIAVTGQITNEQEAEERLRRGARLGP